MNATRLNYQTSIDKGKGVSIISARFGVLYANIKNGKPSACDHTYLLNTYNMS